MRNFLKYLTIYLLVLSGIYLFVASKAFGQVEVWSHQDTMYIPHGDGGNMYIRVGHEWISIADTVEFEWEDTFGSSWIINRPATYATRKDSPNITTSPKPRAIVTYIKKDSSATISETQDNFDATSLKFGITIGLFIGALGMWICGYFIFIHGDHKKIRDMLKHDR